MKSTINWYKHRQWYIKNYKILHVTLTKNEKDFLITFQKLAIFIDYQKFTSLKK